MSHSRTGSVSEFIHFLFRAQLVDHTALQLEKDHPELKGQTGVQLKTFRESSTPVEEEEDDLFDEYDQFLGSSDMSASFTLGQGVGQRAQRAGRGHKRRTSSIFDTSRFSSASSSSSDRSSFVSSPTSTTPSSPTMASVSSGSSGHGQGWRLYNGQPRTSIDSTRTTSTS